MNRHQPGRAADAGRAPVAEAAANAAPPRLHTQPEPSTWTIGPDAPPPGVAEDHAALLAAAGDLADRLGTGRPPEPGTLLVATGHQAAIWHAGILAKDFAAAAFAARLTAAGRPAGALHLVVDQDTHDAVSLEYPAREGDRLRSAALRLGRQLPDVPTGFQEPVDPRAAAEAVRRADAPGSRRLAEALDGVADASPRSLAEQLAAVVHRLREPLAGPMATVRATDLAVLPGFVAMRDAMLTDAAAAARAYNAAAAAHPEAGVAGLRVGRELVELPLWAAMWEQPRRRVFADVSDSTPVWAYEDGEPIDPSRVTLLPRALLMTAAMRSLGCDWFIHGRGGWVYDAVTEAWWARWRGQRLSPMSMVSADLELAMDAPVAEPADLARALWLAHHLPHNMDRFVAVDAALSSRKRAILAHMDDDRDKARRAAGFAQLHAINAALAEAHPEPIAAAHAAVERARAGLANSEVARRRTWPFVWAEEEQLRALAGAVLGVGFGG